MLEYCCLYLLPACISAHALMRAQSGGEDTLKAQHPPRDALEGVNMQTRWLCYWICVVILGALESTLAALAAKLLQLGRLFIDDSKFHALLVGDGRSPVDSLTLHSITYRILRLTFGICLWADNAKGATIFYIKYIEPCLAAILDAVDGFAQSKSIKLGGLLQEGRIIQILRVLQYQAAFLVTRFLQKAATMFKDTHNRLRTKTW